MSSQFQPHTLPILHYNDYGSAVDGFGNADCASGQHGYPLGSLRLPGQPAANPAIEVGNIPGDQGPTFAGRTRVPDRLTPRRLP